MFLIFSIERKGEEDGRGNYTLISNDALETSFTKQIEELCEMPSEHCIYKVPPTLRALNEKVCMAQVVSIHLLHHNKKELKAMEELKLRCMNVFLRCTAKILDDFILVIKGFKKSGRNYYAKKINLNVDKFVKILIVYNFFHS